MNISPCTPNEAEGFEYISDFLYPDGQLDEQALTLFIEAYQKQPEKSRYLYTGSSQNTQKQVPAMGLLLRLIDVATPLWSETFEMWYSMNRMDNETYMEAWFFLLDDAHKETTKLSMLRMLAGAPPIEIRVALMMDGMANYSDLPVQTFIGKSLLRVKSAAFVKALKPRVSQMPMVLRMAKELKNIAPEFSELAQAITMGVFVQRMSEKPPANNPQVEYSACEAFSLVIEHGTIPETALFVKSARSRFKGTCLLSDMLQFVSWALESDRSKNRTLKTPTEVEKVFAIDLMTTLLDDIALQLNSHRSYDAALISAHRVLPKDETVSSKLQQWLIRRFDENKENNMDTSTFVYLLDNLVGDELHPSIWQKWCTLQKKENVQGLLRQYVENGSGYYESSRYYELMRTVLGTHEIINVLHNYAPDVFNVERVLAGHRAYGNTEEDKQRGREVYFLGQVEQFFGRMRNLMSPEVRQSESFKQLVAATSMAYLLHASCSTYAKYDERNGLFINLLAEPLPLLRSMYPEHSAALNTLRKDIIANKSKYHGALYNVLARALYTEASANADTVLGLTESMGVSVYSYFQACTMRNEVHFEVSGDVFDMDVP